MSDAKRSVGRPRRSSREMLEDAAAELFLEQGYPATSIEHITQRAGVSRNTFFNYFTAKSDLLWVDLEDTLGLIAPALAEVATEPVSAQRALTGVREALIAVAAAHPAHRVPWAFSQSELMGTRADLEASIITRLSEPGAAIIATLRRVGGLEEAAARVIAASVLGAAVAGVVQWTDAGVTRGSLEVFVDEAISPVIGGFAFASAGWHGEAGRR